MQKKPDETEALLVIQKLSETYGQSYADLEGGMKKIKEVAEEALGV